MMGIEDIVSEIREDINEQGLPPGFRFHPTDEELVTFYLASKVFNGSFCGVFPIAEVDLNRCEPWELPDVAKVGEREWYFFSLRDRKYPTGVRTNRATGAGYWKATGKDREVKSTSNGGLLGMKKTLVFYKGRAPRGEKTKWVMHEYRLAGAHFSYPHTCKEEWVICRIVHKRGEKIYPTILFQGQSYQLLEACSSPPPLTTTTTTTTTTMGGSLLLPTLPENAAATTTKSSSSSAMLLETQSHYPFLMDHHHHQIQVYQEEGCFSPTSPPPHTHTHPITTTTIPNINPSPSSTSSILFNSLLSHQQLTTTIPKQCNSTTTGGNFSLFQPPHANLLWADKIHTTTDSPPFSNPLFFGMDCGGGVSSAVPDSTTVTVMPTATTSVAAAFSNRANHPIPNLCESSSSSSHISYWTTLAAFGSLRSFQNIDS